MITNKIILKKWYFNFNAARYLTSKICIVLCELNLYAKQCCEYIIVENSVELPLLTPIATNNVEACFDNAITWLNHTKWMRAKYEFRKDRLDLVGGFFSDSVSTCFCSDSRKQFILNIFKYYTKLALAWLHFLQASFTPGTLECSIKVTKKLTAVWGSFSDTSLWTSQCDNNIAGK